MSKVKVAVVVLAGLAVAAAAYWQSAGPGSGPVSEPAESYVLPADLSQWTARDVRYDMESKGITIPDYLDGVWVEDRFFTREEIFGGPVAGALGMGRVADPEEPSSED